MPQPTTQFVNTRSHPRSTRPSRKPSVQEWIQTRMIHSKDFDAMEGTPFRLKPTEHKVLQKYVFLADEWGYRAGKNNHHIKFEKKSHNIDGGRSLQEYTDILFRNLNQNKISLFPQDSWDKASNVDMLTGKQAQESQKLIQAYMKACPSCTKSLLRLANIDLDKLKTPPSPSFVLLVGSVRALLYISVSDFQNALEVMENLTQSLKDMEKKK